jgi:hypothetical protein
MNTQTGDIFLAFDEKTVKANFGKSLSLEEAVDLRALPDTQVRLRRYKQSHADDKCGKCALTLRQHSLKEWQYCEFVLAGGDIASHQS